MDTSTRYLGLHLAHPFVAGASPLTDEVDGARCLEDGGAAAIVMRSLFAEQIEREQVASFLHTDRHGESFAEALSFFPAHDRFAFGPQEYLDHLAKLKAAVHIPVIASLNGTTAGAWLEYACLLSRAGADALELNLYRLALDPQMSGQEVEDECVEVVRQVKRAIDIPLAVKISPFFSSLAHFARRLQDAGADAIVIFNRFYQPDIDPENLQVKETLALSTSSELRLRLRWLAVLSATLGCDLAVTGGVHNGIDGVKSVMAGAHAVQVVSELLQHGPARLSAMRREMEQWMITHEWSSINEMRGNMNLRRCPDPEVYERANYMLILQNYRVNV